MCVRVGIRKRTDAGRGLARCRYDHTHTHKRACTHGTAHARTCPPAAAAAAADENAGRRTAVPRWPVRLLTALADAAAGAPPPRSVGAPPFRSRLARTAAAAAFCRSVALAPLRHVVSPLPPSPPRWSRRFVRRPRPVAGRRSAGNAGGFSAGTRLWNGHQSPVAGCSALPRGSRTRFEFGCFVRLDDGNYSTIVPLTTDRCKPIAYRTKK